MDENLSNNSEIEAPESNTPNTEEENIIEPLRTYERDVAKTVRNQKSSVVSIHLAEKKRSENTPIEPAQKKNATLLTLSILLIVIALGSFVFILFLKTNTAPVSLDKKTTTLIAFDHKKEIDITGLGPGDIARAVIKESETPVSPGSVLYLEIKESEKNIATGEFLPRIAAQISQSLVRSFGNNFMFGLYYSERGNAPFLIIPVQSFDNAFAGMLDWEKNMYSDLNSIFVKKTFSAEAGPSTPPTIKNFEDFIIKSKDTRSLKDSEGNFKLIYSFLNNSSLLITADETTFTEILTRFVTSRSMQ